MVDGTKIWQLNSLAMFSAFKQPSTLTLRALSGNFSPRADKIAAKWIM